MSGPVTCVCGRRLRAVPLGAAATFVVRRTCRGCGAAWVIVVRPLAANVHLHVHQADMTCTRGARASS